MKKTIKARATERGDSVLVSNGHGGIYTPVTAATLEHERLADKYNGQRVRLSGWSHRAMVREQVSRTDDPVIANWPHAIY